MAEGNFKACFAHVLGHEGGYTADRNDRGNWTTGQIGQGQLKGTKWGISAMSYPRLDIRNLTQADAEAIYKRDYWDAARCDELPAGVDLVVFDASVNSGRMRAVKWLQAAIHAKMDGLVGPETLELTKAMDPDEVVARACRIRQDFLEDLPTFARYGKGWTRRVAAILKVGQEMAHPAEELEQDGRQPTGEPAPDDLPAAASTGPELDDDTILRALQKLVEWFISSRAQRAQAGR